MRKFVLIAAVALTASVALFGCGKKQADQTAAQQQTQAVTKPTDVNDTKAWNTYLVDLLQKNLQGMKAERPYAYMVTPGTTPEGQAQNDRQLSSVQDTVARSVLPGNLLAFAGPVSSKTADLILAAFKDAKPGSFKDVIVLFIGDEVDQQRVADVIKPTGATYHFVAM